MTKLTPELHDELNDIIKDIEVKLDPIESRPIVAKLKEFVSKLRPLLESDE